MKTKTVKLGVVGVDSGQLVICDPCYIDSQYILHKNYGDKCKEGEFSYAGICNETTHKLGGQLNYKLGHAGVAVAFPTGLGDGVYDVFAKIEDLPDWGKRVTEVTIKLI